MSIGVVIPDVSSSATELLRSSLSQRRLHRGMQATIFTILLLGALQRNVSVVVNATFGLGVTLLPGVLANDFDVHLGSGLSLFITLAVFLHSLGMFGLYDRLWWWDHLTHVLSAALVASVGYATTRALDDYSDAVYFPAEFLAVFVFLFTVAIGVLWELFEQIGRELAIAGGFEPVLIIYGLEDTMWDLVFDMVGAVVGAIYAGRKLDATTTTLRDYFERASERLE
ncbi:MAG TPA: hypothetical protein VJ898_00350 [Natrialbaceae archaeon]|nr:hypothetical protein [Natrialbaceae archaeon]